VSVTDLYTTILSLLLSAWFIWLPILTLLLFFDVWTTYIRNVFKASIQWSFIEVRIPREILKGPRSMEQVFAALHSSRSAPGHIIERFWKGEMLLWYSFEIMSNGGEIHFYIKTPTKFKNILESNLYAYYPEIEIADVQDYTDNLPYPGFDGTTKKLYEAGYDIWGSELVLGKEDAYPLRTYMAFETMDDYSKIDPISILMETLGKVKPGEHVWIQFLIAPADTTWKERGSKLIQKIRDEGRIKSKVEGGEQVTVDRTPGQAETLRSMEFNIQKPGYQTIVRYVYLAKFAQFSSGPVKSGVIGAFNQYSLATQNSFKQDSEIQTSTNWYTYPFFFPAYRLEWRKERVLRNFKHRRMRENSFWVTFQTGATIPQSVKVLNVEALATLYHYPTNLVLTAPIIQRVEAKKVGPPAGLPIFTESDKPLGFK
jgi:hypothetical protein